MYRESALAVRGEPLPMREETLLDKTSELSVWHLAGSVPLLDIPTNL
jgi:hypothetical protein